MLMILMTLQNAFRLMLVLTAVAVFGCFINLDSYGHELGTDFNVYQDGYSYPYYDDGGYADDCRVCGGIDPDVYGCGVCGGGGICRYDCGVCGGTYWPYTTCPPPFGGPDWERPPPYTADPPVPFCGGIYHDVYEERAWSPCTCGVGWDDLTCHGSACAGPPYCQGPHPYGSYWAYPYTSEGDLDLTGGGGLDWRICLTPFDGGRGWENLLLRTGRDWENPPLGLGRDWNYPPRGMHVRYTPKW